MLNRLGNKSKLLPLLLPLFPARIVSFVDMFAGSLSVSLAMLDRCKYVISNDYDSDVSNLFDIWRTRPDDLAEALEVTPYHENVLKAFKHGNEPDPLWRAVSFVYRSNFSLLAKSYTMKFGQSNNKQITLDAIRDGFKQISRIQFMATDFRNVLDKVCVRHERDKAGMFVFADPPYLNTEHVTYQTAKVWTQADTQDLFALLSSSGLRFAVSEFDSDISRALAAKHGLFVSRITERRNLNNRRVELLITNYEPTAARQISLLDLEKKAA